MKSHFGLLSYKLNQTSKFLDCQRGSAASPQCSVIQHSNSQNGQSILCDSQVTILSYDASRKKRYFHWSRSINISIFFPEGPPEDMRRQAHRLNCCPQPGPALYANRPPSSQREWLALCFFSLSQIVYILDYFSSIVFPWWTQAGLFFGRIASDVLCWRGSTWFGKFLWADQLLSNLGAVSIIKCRAET